MPNASEHSKMTRSGGEGALEAVREHLSNDLNTPFAIEAIDDAASKGDGVSKTALCKELIQSPMRNLLKAAPSQIENPRSRQCEYHYPMSI